MGRYLLGIERKRGMRYLKNIKKHKSTKARRIIFSSLPIKEVGFIIIILIPLLLITLVVSPTFYLISLIWLFVPFGYNYYFGFYKEYKSKTTAQPNNVTVV